MFLFKPKLPAAHNTLHHIISFLYVLAIVFFSCEVFKYIFINPNNYVHFNMSDTLNNLITCFVYGFVIYCFIHNPYFLVHGPPPPPQVSVRTHKTATPAHVVLTTGSALLFSYLGEQTSLHLYTHQSSPEFNITPKAAVVYSTTFVLMLCFLLKRIQLVYINGNGEKFAFPILSACILQALLYVQCGCKNTSCGYRFHHSFLAGWLCLFTADVNYKYTTPSYFLHVVNYIIQCATLGVFVQGINFYGKDGLGVINVQGSQTMSVFASVGVICFLLLTPTLFMLWSCLKKTRSLQF